MHNLRDEPASSLVEKVIALWLAQKVLNEAQAGKRAEELLFAAVDEQNGNVAGVCTTYLRTPPALKMPLWHFRTFVAPEYRQNDVAYHLLHLAIEYHESQYVDGTNTRGRGLYMEIENPIIQRHRNEAVWPSSRMVFTGFNARGDHCRVRYFPGARISQGTSE
jgi:GNAT superfamily N-acetyltransferase